MNQLTISTNICQRRTCRKVAFPASERQCRCTADEQETPLAHLDPRFNENYYSQLSTWNKCKTMVESTSNLVAILRSNMAYDKLKQERDFDFDETNNPGLQFLTQEKPRRSTFLTSFYYAVGGQTMLYSRSTCHPGLIAMFNRVFLENPALLHGFPPTTHLNFYVTYALNALIPWTNLILESIMHEVHDEIAERNGYNENAWETLGPI